MDGPILLPRGLPMPPAPLGVPKPAGSKRTPPLPRQPGGGGAGAATGALPGDSRSGRPPLPPGGAELGSTARYGPAVPAESLPAAAELCRATGAAPRRWERNLRPPRRVHELQRGGESGSRPGPGESRGSGPARSRGLHFVERLRVQIRSIAATQSPRIITFFFPSPLERT